MYMRRSTTTLLASLTMLAVGLSGSAGAALAQSAKWVAGKHYVVIPAQRSQVPAGKIEVMEVFSYGCPACNTFRPAMKQIQAALPKNAQVAYLPASWNAAENWPVFQRAYLTALSLGVADRAHEAMYDAIWTTGELGVVEKSTGRLKKKLPTIEDVARFYERTTGVKAAAFVNASKSFAVDLKIRQAETQIRAMQVPSTPTLVVAGKYRLNTDSVRSVEEIISLINFLVAKESAPAATVPATAKKP
jgi:protein dithiol oxidoreductase (disulfide-forming)